jgi:hypothetical protein
MSESYSWKPDMTPPESSKVETEDELYKEYVSILNTFLDQLENILTTYANNNDETTEEITNSIDIPNSIINQQIIFKIFLDETEFFREFAIKSFNDKNYLHYFTKANLFLNDVLLQIVSVNNKGEYNLRVYDQIEPGFSNNFTYLTSLSQLNLNRLTT